MADLLDKAIMIGLGLEKKAKEAFAELERAGKAAKESSPTGQEQGSEGLNSKQAAENKIVEDGINLLKDVLGAIKSGKEKLDKEVIDKAELVMNRLHIPTQDDLEVIKEMARVSREKVDRLEKMIEELESKKGH